jgi:hypothetical protein
MHRVQHIGFSASIGANKGVHTWTKLKFQFGVVPKLNQVQGIQKHGTKVEICRQMQGPISVGYTQGKKQTKVTHLRLRECYL